jgi:four helix bundle protein
MSNYQIDIDKRSFDFAARIINLVNDLPKTTSGYIIGKQVLRSGTSLGANIQEALGGYTRSDFIYCMNIAKKEARETKYWLKLIVETNILPQDTVLALLKECDELVAILTTIVKNSSKKNQQFVNL